MLLSAARSPSSHARCRPGPADADRPHWRASIRTMATGVSESFSAAPAVGRVWTECTDWDGGLQAPRKRSPAAPRRAGPDCIRLWPLRERPAVEVPDVIREGWRSRPTDR
jgi:hypothetical protein